MAELFGIKHLHFRENVEHDAGLNMTVQSIAAQVTKMTNATIVAACIDYAKEAGITDLHLLDEDFVLNALTRQMPVKPNSTCGRMEAEHRCPICNKRLKAPGIFQFRNGSFCGRCGQRIDWGG
jgi:hypothetical protein